MRKVSYKKKEISHGAAKLSRQGKTLTIYLQYNGAYGMGEKFDSLNQKGHHVVNRVEEKFCFQGDKTYNPTPFFWTDTGFGLYVDTCETTEFDFAEDEPKLPLETAYAVAKLCRDMGAEAKVSSIHENAWFGAYSKADMAAIYLKDYCHADDAENEAMFFGDSPNDEPMFAAFPLSCGVANIAPFADRMAHLPAYLLDGEGGYGFA